MRFAPRPIALVPLALVALVALTATGCAYHTSRSYGVGYRYSPYGPYGGTYYRYPGYYESLRERSYWPYYWTRWGRDWDRHHVRDRHKGRDRDEWRERRRVIRERRERIHRHDAIRRGGRGRR